jgi:hypothetical protein
LPSFPVPKKRSPFGAAVCASTKGSVNVAIFFIAGATRSSPRDVMANPSDSPARNSSLAVTRQN